MKPFFALGLLFASFLLGAPSYASGRTIEMTFHPLGIAQVDVVNVSDIDQNITVEFVGYGGITPALYTPASGTAYTAINCPGISGAKTCSNKATDRKIWRTSDTASGHAHHLRFLVNMVGNALNVEDGFKIKIHVDEDRGAVIASATTQFFYHTNTSDTVTINMPMPLLFNGGRPF